MKSLNGWYKFYYLLNNLIRDSMHNKLIIKTAAFCATALLTIVLPIGIIIDLEPWLQQLASKFK